MLSAGLVVIYFYVYSLLGWISEFLYFLIIQRTIKRPDFLWMPISPPYGIGSLAIILLISQFSANPVLVFILSVALTTVIEYISHVILEKVFRVELWNYEHMKFNFQGRVVLENSIGFGILGLILVYFIHPLLSAQLAVIPPLPIIIAGTILAVALLIDFISATGTLSRLRSLKVSNTMVGFLDYIQSQITQLISLDRTSPTKLHRTRLALLKIHQANVRRLQRAYPNARLRRRKNLKA